MTRTKPWPFVNKSLFLCDPGHDIEDREIFNHVLELLRKDFGIATDEKDPRIQILLDDAVNTYTKLAVFRSKPKDLIKTPQDQIDAIERKLRNDTRTALTTIMNYLMPKKIQKSVTIEDLLSRAGT